MEFISSDIVNHFVVAIAEDEDVFSGVFTSFFERYLMVDIQPFPKLSEPGNGPSANFTVGNADVLKRILACLSAPVGILGFADPFNKAVAMRAIESDMVRSYSRLLDWKYIRLASWTMQEAPFD